MSFFSKTNFVTILIISLAILPGISARHLPSPLRPLPSPSSASPPPPPAAGYGTPAQPSKKHEYPYKEDVYYLPPNRV
ncbi:hypothetical protein COLO4_14012 [Corchorus olitorius]|uniref:Uncharacterized protein n=1 Tax=Corchorus olitorius TaxID=93759 RepID=A0A1R3JU91_9ROSI|nr:hypothetical protein COLO4_14012 [Corchorus olitorius]